MSMKKYLKHFSFLLVIGLVLAACSVDDSESNASGDGKVEIEFWYGLGSEADEKMKELISDFNEEHEDIYDEDDFLDVLLDPGYIDDSLYALPGYGTTQVMYYRKDIFDEVGVDPEEAYETWENLADASKELQDSGEVDYGHLPMWDED